MESWTKKCGGCRVAIILFKSSAIRTDKPYSGAAE
jgi:hypothetical protein